jgi:peptidoglycan/LPS O-acetylase OafA/YrhL
MLSEFYARRFRRILPALTLCLSVTFIFYLLLAPPYPSKTYIENLLTGVLALLGLSNILLSR